MTGPKNTNRYMLVDGNALIHRGYHAIPVLSTKTGEATNAVYGFTLILLKAIKDIKPTHIVCTFDLAGPTFRHEQYKEYKATRVKADQALYDQIPRVKEVVRALNIPIFEMPGFEADDVLGSLGRYICDHEKNSCEALIVTGDLDTLQLVNKCVRVYTMRKGITDTVIYDEKAVRERYGLKPSQMVDYRALKGDPSDNILGVKGIGEKTAAELIKEFGSLDQLYEAVKSGKSKIKERVLNLLIEHEASARQSYDLSRIRLDVPLKFSIPKYEFNPEAQKNTIELFKTLEFRSLVGKLPVGSKSANQQVSQSENLITTDTLGEHEHSVIKSISTSQNLKQDYILVDTEIKLETVLEELSKATELSVDTETTGLNPHEDALVGIGLCAKAGKAFYVPGKLALKSEGLSKLLANENIQKFGHNIKFDAEVLSANDLTLSPICFDTMIASFLLNSSTRQHGLDALAFNELGYQMQPISDLIGTGKKQITMDQVPVEKVSWYCCEDVDMTFRLKEVFEPQIKKEGLTKIFKDIELPLIEVLGAMESKGIILDSKLLNKLAGEAEIEIKKLETEIYKLTGEEFNLNSPKQLKEVLFEKMGLVPVENRKNKSGLSTAAGELEKMLGQHAVIPKILEYREIAKLYSTYLTTLPEMVSKKTGRLHTNYVQTIAATGRLSSTDPNLQNIPVKGEGMGAEVRKAFVPQKGYKLLSLDYSQIELRIVAHLSGDEKMKEVFKKNLDIHTKTAMEIFGLKNESEVTKDMRRDAKTINFGILYGVSSFGLSSRIHEMSRAGAKEFIERYFKAYPKVEEYIEQVKLQVREEAFVKNELGRIRRFPEIKSSQFFIRAAAERAAINFPIQSLAADVIKVAMINIHKLISRSANQQIAMLLQVHDELVFEVQEDQVEIWTKKLKPMMEEAISLSVPVSVEAKVGDNWGEMKVIDQK